MAKHPGGRPSSYTPEIAEAICEGLAQGSSLRKICTADDMPAMSTVCLWLTKHPEFSAQYARARETQMETLFEEIFEIADDTSGDTFVDSEGKERVDHENINRSRLRVDTRKWALSKLSPKRYGERVAAEISGPDGSPIALTPVPPPLPPAEVRLAVKQLLAEAENEIGLAPVGATDAQRLKMITSSGEPLTPSLYEALHGDGGGKDGD
jgi:hypothetical protein